MRPSLARMKDEHQEIVMIHVVRVQSAEVAIVYILISKWRYLRANRHL
jgi:hypothetical protein